MIVFGRWAPLLGGASSFARRASSAGTMGFLGGSAAGCGSEGGVAKVPIGLPQTSCRLEKITTPDVWVWRAQRGGVDFQG